MPHATVVRYTAKGAEQAHENEMLIREVFAELAETAPSGFHYTAIRLGDGLGFVHVALFDTDHNPLTGLPAFREFVSGIDTRAIAGPQVDDATIIGSYRPAPAPESD